MAAVVHVDQSGALSGARILVVEDDFLISTELDTILADAGATVLGPCRTLAQAQRAIVDNNISAAILDFRLGDATALPLAAQLRRHGIPFVFFTGQSNTGQIESACPGARVISKPFQSRTIVAALADVLH